MAKSYDTAREASGLPAEVQAWITAHLGPASLAVLVQEPQAGELRQRLEQMGIEDAVLGLVHRLSREDRGIANEYFAYFMHTLHVLGRRVRSEGLRGFLETGDLVNSVVGDVWRDIAKIEYPGRRQFLSYLAQRLRWKASDRARARNVRPEGHRQELPGGGEWLSISQTGPATLVGREEDKAALSLLLVRLPPRDRELLTRSLRGESIPDIAAAMKMSEAAVRKAIQRAIRKARQLHHAR